MLNYKDKYDVIIIGGGSSGFAAAIKASDQNKHVLVIEEGIIGGTCLNVGCVPTKSLIGASRIIELGQSNAYKGIKMKANPVDMDALITQKNDLLDELRQSKYTNIYESDPNIDIIRGTASFVGEKSIEVDEKTFQGAYFIIATGSRVKIPTIKGIESVDYITSTEALDLRELPERLLVIGAGWVSLEFAKMYQQLGCQVEILLRGNKLLKSEEPEISEAIEQYLVEDGIVVHKSINFIEVSQNDGVKTVVFTKEGNQLKVDGDQLLIATGRIANTEALNLPIANVTLDERGFVKVNEFLQTSNSRIYASGDVIGRYMLVTIDAHEGSIAMTNILFGNKMVVNEKAIPHAVFTTPEIGSVGLTEEQARSQGFNVATRILKMDQVPKALAIHQTRGLIKMVIDSDSREILGVHMIGHLAAEVLQEATLAIRFSMKVDDITSVIHIYPTMAEAIKLVGKSFSKDVSKLSCCAE
ncbi:MAG: mercury(II) reductase [Acidaminobacteraceae bacterium]